MGDMSDDLKWQESVQNFLGSRLVKLPNGDIHREETVVQRHVCDCRLGPFALCIIEGDLYHAAWCSVLMPHGMYVYGPDMESAKQALLAKIANKLERYALTVRGGMPIPAEDC